MITIIGADGDVDIAQSGIDIRTLLWHRRQAYAALHATPDAIGLQFFDSAADAAGLLLYLIRNGGLTHDDIGPLPPAVEAIIRDNAWNGH